MGVKRERCGLQLQQKKESQELQEEEEEEVPEEGVHDVLGREGNSKNERSQLKAATFIPKSGRIWKSQAQRQKASQQRREGKMFGMR